jgi:hypothetical protein
VGGFEAAKHFPFEIGNELTDIPDRRPVGQFVGIEKFVV